jgi:hypothetical protein
LSLNISSLQLTHAVALEYYFSRSLGFSLLSLSILCLANAGLFSSSSPLTSTPQTYGTTPGSAPTPAALIITMLYHFATSLYMYGMYVGTGQMMFMAGTIGSGSMFAMGVWCVLFGAGSRVSARTHADKRTSGWPFGNVKADEKRVPKKAD